MKRFSQMLIGSAMMFVVVQMVGAASVNDEIAERIRKVGQVCVEGEDCADASAATQVATAGNGGTDVKAIYDRSCATCHAIGVAGAPKFGDAAAWAPRIEKGMDVLYTSSIEGMPPGMPAKGMCFTCSDDDLEAVVDYMVEAAQ
ncbi:MAG: c-type cytochrome [Pseudomonadales bacterium]